MKDCFNLSFKAKNDSAKERRTKVRGPLLRSGAHQRRAAGGENKQVLERGKLARQQAGQLEGRRIESGANSIEIKDAVRIPLPEKARSPDRIFWIMPGLPPFELGLFWRGLQTTDAIGPRFRPDLKLFSGKSMNLQDARRGFRRYARGFRRFKKPRKPAFLFESGRILTGKRHDSPDFGEGGGT